MSTNLRAVFYRFLNAGSDNAGLLGGSDSDSQMVGLVGSVINRGRLVSSLVVRSPEVVCDSNLDSIYSDN